MIIFIYLFVCLFGASCKSIIKLMNELNERKII